MPLTDLDRLYFGMHERRHYRLRRPTPAELADWSVQPDRGSEPWCIVRRTDGAVEWFALRVGEALDDNDLELSAFFESLQQLE